MRVFVIGTGRCGSVSFRVACSFMTNYTTGHETKCGLLEYPDNFIEVNPHLRCCVAHVANKYPDALWVHLLRKPETCIPSLAALDHGAIMRAYASLYGSVMPSENIADIAYRYYWAETDAIRSHLKSVAKSHTMHLETIQDEWAHFWNLIGAEGNYAASLHSWGTPHNTRAERGEA